MACFHPVDIIDPKTNQPVQVPCGACIGCLSSKRSDWAFRLKIESQHCVMPVFFTLTYNEACVPICKTENLSTYHETERDTKEILRLKDVTDPGTYSRVVSSRDICNFIKKVRTYYPYWNIRYFITSEYGPKTFRPHYHGLFFVNWNEDYVPRGTKSSTILQNQRKFFSVTSIGECIEHCWRCDNLSLGFTSYRSPLPADMEYLGKYVTKEMDEKNPTKTWQRMSKRPYIGYQLLQDSSIYSYSYNRLEDNDGYLNLDLKTLPRIYQRKGVPSLYSSIFTYRREKYKKLEYLAYNVLKSGSLEHYNMLPDQEKKYVDDLLRDPDSLLNQFHQKDSDNKFRESQMIQKHKEYWKRKSEYNEFLPQNPNQSNH